LDEKLTNITEDIPLECQNGFRKGRSCIDSGFYVKLLIARKKKESFTWKHFAFVDHEKAFDKVKGQKLFNILKENNIY
jgi:hypothetical protein